MAQITPKKKRLLGWLLFVCLATAIVVSNVILGRWASAQVCWGDWSCWGSGSAELIIYGFLLNATAVIFAFVGVFKRNYFWKTAGASLFVGVGIGVFGLNFSYDVGVERLEAARPTPTPPGGGWGGEYAENESYEFSCAFVEQIPAQECEALVAFNTATYKALEGHKRWPWLSSNAPCSWVGVNCRDNHVTELHLSQYYLTGRISQELGVLSHLQILDLSSNLLVGPIPASYGDLQELQMLDFNNNNLSGTIPKELGNLRNLWYLGLGANRLGGGIPKELGKLTKLQSLILGFGNSLNKEIPTAILDLPNLCHFDLVNLRNCVN